MITSSGFVSNIDKVKHLKNIFKSKTEFFAVLDLQKRKASILSDHNKTIIFWL